MEILETGVVTIRPHKMDLHKKGSFRTTRDIMKVGNAAMTGDPAAFEAMLNVIIANSEIEAPTEIKDAAGKVTAVDLRELLLDELSMEEAKDILGFISGRGAVSPTNGALSEAG